MAVLAAGHFHELHADFIYPLQSATLARSLCSKQEMAELAQQCGICTPANVFPRSLDDVLRYIESARFPVLLKGINGNRLKERTGKNMVIVYSPRQLRDLYLAIETPDDPNLMIQEFIPGGDDSVWMFNGYFNAGSECLVSFTGRRLRQAPVHTGVTTLGICARNDVVERTTREFMRVLGYKGIVDVEYRYDARDGQYKLLGINPRISAAFRIFVDGNGIDVARALYLDLTGQEIPPACPREGRKWFVESDFKSCLDYRREGKLTFWQWLHSLHGIQEAGYFAWDDLAPVARLCSMGLSNWIRNPRRSRTVRIPVQIASRTPETVSAGAQTSGLSEDSSLGGD
jgi:predicted ATP-grasp superfamily ATP-dependent carboligase